MEVKDNVLHTELNNGVLCIFGVEDFSLERSCNCGQTFRWTNRDGLHSCVIGRELVHAWQKDGVLNISPCDEARIQFYLNYFDLNRDYTAIEKQMQESDMLIKCIPYAGGIRVFSQDPFETLISFIVSANNNIKRITAIIDRLCKSCGDELVAGDGSVYYAFPTAEALSCMTVESLRELGLGYRDEYIKRTAQAIADGFSLEALREMPYAEAKKRLCTLHGVGTKVADCVLLFSLGHGEAFPMDVWMKRAVSRMFFNGKTPSKAEFSQFLSSLGSDAGRIQQYIFHYARETGLS